MEGEQEQIEELRDNQKEVLSRRISFWLSFISSIAITFWYYSANPPDSKEMRKMRSFFKQNIMDVEIDNSQDWQRKIKNSLQINYGRAPYWHEIFANISIWIIPQN